MLGEKLERTIIVVVPKLKMEVVEYSSSLKASLDAMKLSKRKDIKRILQREGPTGIEGRDRGNKG